MLMMCVSRKNIMKKDKLRSTRWESIIVEKLIYELIDSQIEKQSILFYNKMKFRYSRKISRFSFVTNNNDVWVAFECVVQFELQFEFNLQLID